MKTLLWVLGIFSLLAGLALGANVLFIGLARPDPLVNRALFVGFGYIVTGLVSFALLGGLSKALEHLEEIKAGLGARQ